MLIDAMVLVVTFGSAFVIVGYEIQARHHGWPVGEWLSGDATPLKIWAFLALIATPVVALLQHWWLAVVVVIAGFFYGFSITTVLRYRAQIASVIGLVVGSAITLFIAA